MKKTTKKNSNTQKIKSSLERKEQHQRRSRKKDLAESPWKSSNDEKKTGSVKNIRQHDPFLAREQQKYSDPLPSREFIYQLIHQTQQSQPAALSLGDLMDLLAIKDHERQHFLRRLRAMVREGQLVDQGRGWTIAPGSSATLPESQANLSGRVQRFPEGYALFIPDIDPKTVYGLDLQGLENILSGDRIEAACIGLDNRRRPLVRCQNVLERSTNTLVGQLEYRRVEGWFLNIRGFRPGTYSLPVKAENRKRAKAGSWVVAKAEPEINDLTLHVIEILGDTEDDGIEIEIAVARHGLPHEFSADVLTQVRKLPTTVRAQDCKNRKDLRHLPLVTIDGETAKDFDDAVCAIRQDKGFKLWVAIADVSYYVPWDSALDHSARERGTSVYFPRRVLPMLPEALSNGLCSLNPHVDRLCMVCEINFSATGVLEHYEFYPAVMHSQARLTYTQVHTWLSKPEEWPSEFESLRDPLHYLNDLFKVLLKQRAKRGAIDFDTLESVLVFDEHGKMAGVEPSNRNDAHRLIEECMLAANVCAADYLLKKEAPALYRIHVGPSEEKLEQLRTYLKLQGLGLTGGNTPKTKDYALLMQQISERPDKALLQTVMLRSMQQAVYSPANAGHFGLAYEAYAHFTSPIRRYPDLMVHRSIKALLGVDNLPQTSWKDLGIHCSQTERRADEASREVTQWLKCQFMQDKVGQVFKGTISGVTHFGVFVTLTDFFIDGLIPIQDLHDDYYKFQPEQHRLIGERTKRVFSLMDTLDVQVTRADLDTLKIDFALPKI
ncbi:MAG: ribonuclease R [Pseudomonadota bacterium]